MSNKLGIIGCGNMGWAIARGVIAAKLIPAGNLYLYDIDRNRATALKKDLKANIADSSEELTKICDAILISVKPQDIGELFRKIGHVLNSSKLLMSIAAGSSIEKIKKYLKGEIKVVRVMPNMAALVNKGISALCYDNLASAGDKEFVKNIFKSIGDIVELKEEFMDAVTAISGSGPAYYFYITEILEKSAMDMGIDKDKARLLAIQTALGSAALLKDSGLDVETLRKRVTSKGGTTEAAFKVFSDKKLGEILREGIRAAKERAKELSEGN